MMIQGESRRATLSDTTPNSVTLNLTYGSLLLCFLPHAPDHLWYDECAHEHGGPAPGREETGWTLSRSWIR